MQINSEKDTNNAILYRESALLLRSFYLYLL